MSDEHQGQVPEPVEMCDHICLKPADHVDKGEPHFYGYEHPSPRKSAREFLASPSFRAGSDDEFAARVLAEEVERLRGEIERLRATPARAEPSEAEIDAAAKAFDEFYENDGDLGLRTEAVPAAIAKTMLLAARAVMTDPQNEEGA